MSIRGRVLHVFQEDGIDKEEREAIVQSQIAIHWRLGQTPPSMQVYPSQRLPLGPSVVDLPTLLAPLNRPWSSWSTGDMHAAASLVLVAEHELPSGRMLPYDPPQPGHLTLVGAFP